MSRRRSAGSWRRRAFDPNSFPDLQPAGQAFAENVRVVHLFGAHRTNAKLAGGNRSRAAQLLGISRSTFYRRLKARGIPNVGLGEYEAFRKYNLDLTLKWRNLVKPTVAMLPFAVGSLVIEHWWTANNLIIFFTQVALVLPLAAIGAWYISLTADERIKLTPVRLSGPSTSNV